MLDWWLPENVSTYGADIDNLFHLIYWITMITWVLVQVLMVVFLVMYRHRPGRRATYTHGNTSLEIAWTIVPTLIVIWLGIRSVETWNRVKIDLPETKHVVGVVAKQFNWEMVYPGPDGEFATEDDKTIENDLRVPVNTPIRVRLSSKDVIHSFFLPNLRMKQDVVPGRTIEAWFEATKPGKYEIPCAELCGFGHSGMLGFLTVYTPEEYEAWVKEQWPSQQANREEGSHDRARTNG
jgi:cytochrome c oxidase subunit 2